MCANNAFHFSNFHYRDFHFANAKAPNFHKSSTILVERKPILPPYKAQVKTTGETGGLHSPYKGQLQAEPLKGAQKV